jgi:hypothetical protein
MTAEKQECWAIVELMGHVKMAGRISEEERFGAKMGRIDIPKADGSFVTQWFGGSTVYRITPTTEEAARKVATLGVPAPVHLWELPAPELSQTQLSEAVMEKALAEIDDYGEEHG